MQPEMFTRVGFIDAEMDHAAVDAMRHQRSAHVARGAADRDTNAMAALALDETAQGMSRRAIGQRHTRQIKHESLGPPPNMIKRGGDHAGGAEKEWAGNAIDHEIGVASVKFGV